ncbi:hypothetical protein CBER1_08825 [Cercospora berteroae]|uniref:Uncharacterized protein n=1 Tax=Cercospora berteroae TaxID=357750 RepID=A0A2S6BW02_9PEZI|nr:hypothetical protein CBER1_08825 [Cercospora berteroae]
MTVPPDNSPANNAGGGRLAPKPLNSMMSCDAATPPIVSLSEVGDSAAADTPPLTGTLHCSKSTGVAEVFAHDGLMVATDLVTGTDDATKETANVDSRPPKSSAPSASQNDCLFLNKLPAELRNEIYELAFTSHDDEVEIDLSDFDPPRNSLLSTKGEVDLSKAEPPNISLLSTCRQIQSEATQLYQRANHQYWTDTHFVVTNLKPNDPHAPPEIQSLKQDLWGGQNPRLKSENIDRIRHIRICRRPTLEFRFIWIFTYLSKSGIWLHECVDNRQVNPSWTKYLVLETYASRAFPLWEDWYIASQKSDAEMAAKEWNHKKPSHVELGSMVFLGYD